MRAEVPYVSEISRFPPVRRDLAVVVDESLAVQSLLDAMPAQCPWAVEFPLVGNDLVDVTRKEISRLKEISGERYVD